MIDRKKENQLVLKYQETESDEIFLQIYEPRKKTFEHLAKRFYYVAEDMYSEMQVVFMKSIMGFKPNCRSFNTYFYTSVLNHVRNMIKSQGRNKRTLSDGTDPNDSFLYLDDAIDEDGDMTYHDVISSGDGEDMIDVMHLIEYVEGRSWILLDMVLDMMGSGKPPLKRKTYESSTVICGYYSVEEAVEAHAGIPSSCYRLVDFDVEGDEMKYVIDVSMQKAYDVLVEMVSHLSEGYKTEVVV